MHLFYQINAKALLHLSFGNPYQPLYLGGGSATGIYEKVRVLMRYSGMSELSPLKTRPIYKVGGR